MQGERGGANKGGYWGTMIFLIALFLMWGPLGASAGEVELERYESISMLSLPSGVQAIHLDPLRGTLTLRFEEPKSRAKKRKYKAAIEKLDEQIALSSLFVGRLERDRELILTLGTLGVSMDLLQEDGETFLVVGSLREVPSPRAHFLASECLSTFPLLEEPFLVEAVDSYCRGKALKPLPDGYPLNDFNRLALEMMTIESGSALDEAAVTSLGVLVQTEYNPELKMSGSVGLAMMYALKDQLPEALEALESAREVGDQLSAANSELISTVGGALFERMVRLAIEEKDALRLVYQFERFGSWSKKLDKGVLLALASACIQLELPEFAADFYLDALMQEEEDDPILLAALASAYDLSGEAFRAQETRAFLSEQFPSFDISAVELPTLAQAAREIDVDLARCEPKEVQEGPTLMVSIGCFTNSDGQRFASALNRSDTEEQTEI